MFSFKKVVAVILSACIIFVATPAISLNAKMSLDEFLSACEEISVEYQYPSQKLALAESEHPAVNKIKVPAGLPIQVRLLDTLKSEDIYSGQDINFMVISDVMVDGKLVVKANTPVNAQVSFAEEKGFFGKPGKIIISDFSTTANDGSYIPLRATISAEGQSKETMALILGLVICFPFLFWKGKTAVIPAGTTKTVYTAGMVYVNNKN